MDDRRFEGEVEHICASGSIRIVRLGEHAPSLYRWAGSWLLWALGDLVCDYVPFTWYCAIMQASSDVQGPDEEPGPWYYSA